MESLPIINLSYEIYKQLVRLHENMPKRWRYSLCLRTENSLLDLLEQLHMAKCCPKALKAHFLIQASGKLELCRLQLRLYIELELANTTRLFQLQARLQEVGKMLGGWLKASQSF